MKKILLWSALALLLAPAAFLSAQDQGPGGFIDYSGRPPYIYKGERQPLPGPLAFAFQVPALKNYTPLVLVGKIAAETDELNYYYEFYDTSGRVTLKILPSKWMYDVGPNDVIVVEGKVDALVSPAVVEVEQISTRNHYYAVALPPRGPLPMGVVSVEFAKTLPDTATVALQGYVDKRLEEGKKRFLFHDKSGSIVLCAEDSNPLVAGPYDPGDLLVVEGRMNTEVNPPEVDVETVVDRSNFTVVDVERDVVVKTKNGGDVVVEESAEVAVPNE